jgi:segregation and condensation protein B
VTRRKKKEPTDTTPPESGVDEAGHGHAQPGSPVEDMPTVNLTGDELGALGAVLRDDAAGEQGADDDAAAPPSEGAATESKLRVADTVGVEELADLAAKTGEHAAAVEGLEELGDANAADGSGGGGGSAEDEAAGVEQARELSRNHLKGLLEALVFASDKPLKSGELARLASAPVKQVRELLKELEEAYAGRGIVLGEIAGGWLFRTSVEYAPFVREMASEKPVRLTRAQVETLAIAAYRQPITRPEIDDIRGVDSGATLKLLLERDLLRILGKKDEPGRPLLYGTTSAFLEFFGLKSLKDLPTLKEFTELSDESRRVAEAELGEVLPEHAQAQARATEPATRAPASAPDGEPGHTTDPVPDPPTDHGTGPMSAPISSGESSDTLTPPPEHDTLAPPAPPSRDSEDDTFPHDP